MSRLPTQFSLVQYSGPIFDQAEQGSCKANQICGALALMANEYGEHIAPLSRQQLYNDTRSLMGSFERDSGSTYNAANEVITHTGIGNESSFAYGSENLYVHPGAEVHAEAARQKVLSVTPVNEMQGAGFLAQDIMLQLLQGKPVLVDAFIHPGFGTVEHDLSAPYTGGHAYYIVGADFSTRTYTFANSWGESWMENGFGTLKFLDLPGVHANTPYQQDVINVSVLDGFAGHDLRWTESRTDMSDGYLVLGRSADQAGLYYWADAMDGGMSFSSVLDSLIASPEGAALYGHDSDREFVSEAYGKLLGRPVEASGADWWAAQLAHETRGQLVANMIEAVHLANDTDTSALFNRSLVVGNGAITFQDDGSNRAAEVAALVGVGSGSNMTAVLHNLHTALYGV